MRGRPFSSPIRAKIHRHYRSDPPRNESLAERLDVAEQRAVLQRFVSLNNSIHTPLRLYKCERFTVVLVANLTTQMIFAATLHEITADWTWSGA